jgi:hypothetical protein
LHSVISAVNNRIKFPAKKSPNNTETGCLKKIRLIFVVQT